MPKEILKRTIYFDDQIKDDIEKAQDIIIDYKSAFCNWDLKDKMRKNTERLRTTLKAGALKNVKVKNVSDISKCDENLRVYIYVTKQCHVNEVKTKGVSHALQVSLGNKDTRSDWVSADEGFSAKVFVDDVNKLTNLVEDIVLDMQMFYYYGYDLKYSDFTQRREFSQEKVSYLAKKGLKSYLGKIIDPEYVSFASFCRNQSDMDINMDIDMEKYCKMWQEFYEDKFKENKTTYKNDINQLFKGHPKYGQISLRKIEKLLRDKDTGEYILVRTEKKPRNKKILKMINTCFGMNNWKTGKIKIVDLKKRAVFEKMIPYVSIYVFQWKGL